jgi:hypothetical protein
MINEYFDLQPFFEAFFRDIFEGIVICQFAILPLQKRISSFKSSETRIPFESVKFLLQSQHEIATARCFICVLGI